MTKSAKQTEYLLTEAHTNSEWDNCAFALIHITDEWKERAKQRLEAVKPFKGDYYFQSVNYRDGAVDFYQIGEDEQPDIASLLDGKEWAFVETDEAELKNLSVPENRLNCYTLVVLCSGVAYYTASGKYSNEEFWTDDFSLQQIIE